MVGQGETDMKTNQNSNCDGGATEDQGRMGQNYTSMAHSAVKLSVETLIWFRLGG